ncbi:MAG: putative enoyl-CoA hydratase [Candidatus Eremiobacteraeota bacterium]|nr:putative enoyl-CoA hydratase [Candidatus Eremiobacteraeota bacterium]
MGRAQVFHRRPRERDAIVTQIEEIVATRCGRIGQIVIDRPRALNALDDRMFAAIGETLTAWRDDPAVEAVVVRGAGTTFSAGGDIRMVRDAALAGDDAALARMYRAEYSLDALIDAYPKPYIAAIDGYCMGGGLGVAMYGSFRVVTERALLAMPEVGIGFFPDVGASYVLPRLPDRIGWYMGLTGARLSAADALACGLATHQLDDAAFAHVEAIVADDPARAAIARRFDAVAVAPQPSAVDAVRSTIARCFDQPSLTDIIEALERERGEWAEQTLATMRAASPTSLAMTCELFHRGSTLSLAQCLEMEYQLAVRVARSRDFLEGVRAMVIDKDRTPRWNPSCIEDLPGNHLAELWNVIDLAGNELRLRL